MKKKTKNIIRIATAIVLLLGLGYLFACEGGAESCNLRGAIVGVHFVVVPIGVGVGLCHYFVWLLTD